MNRYPPAADEWSQGHGGTMILQSLAGLPAFLVYFCTGLVAIVAYLLVYLSLIHI